MGKPSSTPRMMRFKPESGWSEAAAEIIPINEHAKSDANDVKYPPDAPASATPAAADRLPAETLVDIGESMQDVFNSLKISDPRLQTWTQVHAAIRLISGKLQEKQALQARIDTLDADIQGVRKLAAELVHNAWRSEQEIHETSKLRMQIAESLSEKLTAALKC